MDSLNQTLELLGSRRICYTLFSRVTSDPIRPGWDPLLEPGVRIAAVEAGRTLVEAVPRGGALAPGEADPANLAPGALLDGLAAAGLESVRREYRALFGLLTPKDCPPYETDYCPQTFSVYRSQQMADIAGYYNAFGVAPSPERPDRPDHISLELEFMGWLVAKEAFAVQEGDEDHADICREAQQSFTEKHLCWWAPAFAKALRDKAEAASPACGFYAALGRALPGFIASERTILKIPVPARLVEPLPADPGPMACDGCDLEPAKTGLFTET